MYRINSFIKEAQRLYPLQCVSPCRSLDALRYLIPSRVSRRLSPRDKYLTLTWHQLPYLLLGLTTVACDSLRCEQHAICNNDREAELPPLALNIVAIVIRRTGARLIESGNTISTRMRFVISPHLPLCPQKASQMQSLHSPSTPSQITPGIMSQMPH